MRIQQFIKSLNNTELGKGSTHEFYVLVPTKVNIIKIFDKTHTNPDFYDCVTDKIKKNLGTFKTLEEAIEKRNDYFKELLKDVKM